MSTRDEYEWADQRRLARQDREEFGDPEDNYDESADLDTRDEPEVAVLDRYLNWITRAQTKGTR